MIELFLCKARRQIRSIVNLCEEFGVRRIVQIEPIRTIFYSLEPKQRSPASPRPGTIYLCGLRTGSTVATQRSTSAGLVCCKTKSTPSVQPSTDTICVCAGLPPCLQSISYAATIDAPDASIGSHKISVLPSSDGQAIYSTLISNSLSLV